MSIKIGRAAGSSVGGLQVAMLSCGYIGANAKKVLKGIKYDGLMRMVGRLEDKDRPLFRKILLAPFALIAPIRAECIEMRAGTGTLRGSRPARYPP